MNFRRIITFFIISLLFLETSTQETFDSFKTWMEGKALDLAQEMESIYNKKCGTSVVECEVKSYNYCEGTSEK